MLAMACWIFILGSYWYLRLKRNDSDNALCWALIYSILIAMCHWAAKSEPERHNLERKNKGENKKGNLSLFSVLALMLMLVHYQCRQGYNKPYTCTRKQRPPYWTIIMLWSSEHCTYICHLHIALFLYGPHGQIVSDHVTKKRIARGLWTRQTSFHGLSSLKKLFILVWSCTNVKPTWRCTA